MTSRALAWRTVASNPARAVLAVTGVAVIGALLFDMLLLSNGLLISFRDLLDSAGYDVRIMATDGLPASRSPIPNPGAVVGAVAPLAEVQDVAVVRMDTVQAEAGSRHALPLTLIGVTEGAERHAWRIVEGAPLARATTRAGAWPLVVNRTVAAALHLHPGSVVRLRITPEGGPSAIPAVPFQVAGIAEFSFESGSDRTAATTAGAFQAAHGSLARDEADIILVASAPEYGAAAAVAAIRRVRPDLRAFSNDQVLAQFNRNGFSYFRQISLVLSSITLAFAFLLVATLLTVSVNQQLSEVAALRALGVPRWRISATLLWQSGLLVGVGGAAALPLGGLLAFELDRILRAMPGIPDRLHFFVLEPRAVLIHVLLLAATGLCAAVYPIWVAARLPIAETLRREVVS